ncbi:MAG: Ig-like domain-containing protein [Chloroflexi bacterium]|nr:Ig-like domain-containing protein [Chloroflexota bacterium]
MMEDSHISRRAFLKKFVILSMLSVAEGCLPEAQPEYGVEVTEVHTAPVPEPVYGVEPMPVPEYGVEPVPMPEYGVEPVETLTQVSQMTYLDENGVENVLYGSTDVPINAQFIISFVYAMDPSSQDAVTLSDADNSAVGFESSWSSETALKIIPDVALRHGTHYTLAVSEEAKNLGGLPLQFIGTERAEFTTIEP